MPELSHDQLYRPCDPSIFHFDTTDEVAPLSAVIGQERAIQALETGLKLKNARNRYNVFVAGDPGTGKLSAVQRFVEDVSAEQTQPPDICYVHNFADPYRPRYLRLPAGQGQQLKADMERLIDSLQEDLPQAFESDEYQERREQVDEQYKEREQAMYERWQQEAESRGFQLQQTQIGIQTVPLNDDGEPMTREQFQELDEETQRQLRERQEELQEIIQRDMRQASKVAEERSEAVEELNREVASFVITPRIQNLKERYGANDRATAYLDEVLQDLIHNVDIFLNQNGGGQGNMPQMVQQMMSGGGDPQQDDPFRKYDVNVLVDHGETDGAPVVIQENATYPNLFGRVERRMQMGAVTTDFLMIRPGSIHEANGGYLILNAENLLRSPMSWHAIKVALRRKEVEIEDVANMLGYGAAEGLKPEALPLDVKFIVIGNRYIYDLLQAYDEDFRKLFSIKSEFDTDMERTEETERQFAGFLRARSDEDPHLLPFDPTGTSRLVEYASECADDQSKLSACFSDLMTIVDEASFRAREVEDDVVTRDHVQSAIEARDFRHNLLEDKVREMITRGEIFVDTEGTNTGQINGLSVLSTGDHRFGRPTRITATVHTGKDGVTNIEREADLSGNIHTKGLLILKSWLGDQFARNRPLSLSASLTFEQSYGTIDGDSASAAELAALISELAGVPIHQGVAITGSVNQKGQIQPIGGVNEKIEGFYKVCKVQGLTGEQGVVVPEVNEAHLMLASDVRNAVEAGQFHVWSVATIEEALEILTGQTAGSWNPEANRFDDGTTYAQVDDKLGEIAERLRDAEEAEGNGAGESPSGQGD
ncbi:MAG: AAA family ATPase [Candidatus Bipolaricaulia bacterium]